MPAASTIVSVNVTDGFSGQLGNAVPLSGPGSTQVLDLEYGLMAAFRRPIVNAVHSTAGITIGASMSGAMITYAGLSATLGSAYIFTLPKPDPGLWFEFTGLGICGCSAATEWQCGTSGTMIVSGDSGGADGVIVNATTVDEFLTVSFIAYSTANYVVRGWSGSSNTSTGAAGVHMKGSS